MTIIPVTEDTTFAQMRAAAHSPHELMTMLDSPEGSTGYGYWIEFGSVDAPMIYNVFTHGPDWVCMKREGSKGEPMWHQWRDLDPFRVVVA